MKKRIAIVCALILILIGCSKSEERSYSGLNAEILSVDNDLIIVKAEDSDILEFNKEYFVDVSHCPIYYIDFDTEELLEIDIEDLFVGDHITMDVTESGIKENLITPEQIQLITQRDI